MISVSEAQRLVLDTVAQMDAEVVDIRQACGRTAAEDVVSDCDIPFFDNSAMDGYAVLSSDVASASKASPVTLEVIEEIPAGKVPTRKVSPGKAIKIMTGAPMPAGADNVVMLEDTEQTENHVTVFAPPKRDNVRPRGEDIAAGSGVIEAGTLLRPQEVGLLASVGRSRIQVARQPRVAILATGDEIIECNKPMEMGKVRNSNAYTLAGMVRDCGAVPFDLGIARDTKEAIALRLKSAMSADVIVTSGGVSVGEYDFVKEVLQDLGMEQKFWGVRMKPGKPSVFGAIGNRLVFGLPGNPVSVMVCFELFIRPAILQMLGQRQVFRPEVEAILDEDVRHKGDRHLFLCGHVCVLDGKYHVRVKGPQGSGILRSMALANALISLPEDRPAPRAGSVVSVLLLNHPTRE